MTVKLEHEDFINLVMGTSPVYGIMNLGTIRSLGTYDGSYDRWTWNISALRELTEKELWNIYKLCKVWRTT